MQGDDDFRETVRRLCAGLTLEDVARACSVSYSLARKASAGLRTPPRDWRRVIAELARTRADELDTLADSLDPPE